MNNSLLKALALAAGFVVATVSAAPPNIVVILADDLGYGSIGAYGADPKLVATPHLDRLAREGRTFTDATCSSSVCSPTRYALLTGRWCARTSLKSGVLGINSPLHIETTRPTVASLLKTAGYRTAVIGKWHLGYGVTEPDYSGELRPGPLEIGFDYHFGLPINHGDLTGVYIENHRVWGLGGQRLPANADLGGPPDDADDYSAAYTANDTETGRPPLELVAPHRRNERVMSVLTKKAIGWIEQQNAKQPFFLYLPVVAVHNPVTPDAAQRGRSEAGVYGDWIVELDVSVGRILAALDRLDLAKNTLVIVTSDNGGVLNLQRANPQNEAMKAGLALNGPWKAGKFSPYEGGFRVPFIARWPAQVPAGTTSAEPISMLDFFATFAALTGQKMPPVAQGAEDSYDISPALLGRPHEKPLRPFVLNQSGHGAWTLREGPWKFIEAYDPATEPGAKKSTMPKTAFQLYNLAQDPGEKSNLYEEKSDVAARLQTRLTELKKSGHSR